MTKVFLIITYSVLAYGTPHQVGPFVMETMKECEQAGLGAPQVLDLGEDFAYKVGWSCVMEEVVEESRT